MDSDQIQLLNEKAEERRVKLHTLLESFCPNVEFQPDVNSSLVYPCILYSLDDIDVQFADNRPYRLTRRYQLTVIDREPTTGLVTAVSELPGCAFEREFKADNLYHDIFNIFY